MQETKSLLKKYFGSDELRPGQSEAINAILSGRDVIAVMPTGSGKSLCYQLPAMALPGLTVVISPLIALMKDQVESLKAKGIPAAYLNSSLSPEELLAVGRGISHKKYRLLYVSPERLANPGFIGLMQETDISLVAIDEAHCVSQWGQSFRPAYLEIAKFIRCLPHRPVVGAFTATATKRVKKDIARLLELKTPKIISTGFDRPNLYFGVIRCKYKRAKLDELMQRLKGKCGIIYCQTRSSAEETYERLKKQGYPVSIYHAGLSANVRQENQERFLCGKADVMVSTCAFGMGIDKPDISFIIHMSMPKDIESYYQEIGRAGRDGRKAVCLLLYSPKDSELIRWMIENQDRNSGLTRRERKKQTRLELKRLSDMQAFCETSSCLRGFMLKYFGSKPCRKCRLCSNCVNGGENAILSIVLSGKA